eukprot:CAMPEP_0178588284 /NCGR_PEP_ID=MMETSP0697-20121206/26935_1 /TAXON_ID=265572 /ORGANISM="Extubocellulus spinifer, Strain CCMP396" /LENGTH=252 /DNA_ID=CAMNT_0020224591 /DNA_START=67 /DNA_END=825 /DNA_ORIENTATION=-
MKLSLLTLAALLGVGSAFVPTQQASFSRVATPVFMADDEAPAEAAEEGEEEAAPEPAPAPAAPAYKCMSREEILSAPNTIEFGQKWDPLGLSDLGSDETIAWFRHAEVKHGRVAMAAFVGWWAVGAGLRFPGELATGLDFSSIPSKGIEAWDAVPGIGKVQMLLFAGLLEFHDELFFSRRGEGGHYLRGGVPGKNMVPGLFDPLGLSSMKTPEQLARGRDVEIKNGRLAMIGFAGLWAEASISGSVPFQPDC